MVYVYSRILLTSLLLTVSLAPAASAEVVAVPDPCEDVDCTPCDPYWECPNTDRLEERVEQLRENLPSGQNLVYALLDYLGDQPHPCAQADLPGACHSVDCSNYDLPGLCYTPGPCDVVSSTLLCGEQVCVDLVVAGACHPDPCGAINAPHMCYQPVCYDLPQVPYACGPGPCDPNTGTCEQVDLCEPLGVQLCVADPPCITEAPPFFCVPEPCNEQDVPVVCDDGIVVDPCAPDAGQCTLLTRVQQLVDHVRDSLPTTDDVNDTRDQHLPDGDGDDVPDLVEQVVCGSAVVRDNLDVAGYVHCATAADLYVEPAGTFTDAVNETRDLVVGEALRTAEEVNQTANAVREAVEAKVEGVRAEAEAVVVWAVGEVEALRDQVDADGDGVADEAEPLLCQVENVNFPQDGSCDEGMTDYTPPA